MEMAFWTRRNWRGVLVNLSGVFKNVPEWATAVRSPSKSYPLNWRNDRDAGLKCVSPADLVIHGAAGSVGETISPEASVIGKVRGQVLPAKPKQKPNQPNRPKTRLRRPPLSNY